MSYFRIFYKELCLCVLGVQRYLFFYFSQIFFKLFYLYLGVYRLLSGTTTSGFPL